MEAKGTRRYYQWKWVCEEDDALIVDGRHMWEHEADCRQEAERYRPVMAERMGMAAKLILTIHDKQDKSVPTKEIRGTFDLGHDVRVQALYFDRQPRIDIRKWSSGYGYPLKRGLPLSPQRWASLLELRAAIQGNIKKIQAKQHVDVTLHVSGPVFLSMASPFWTLNIREWYMEGGVKKPGWKGIVLRFSDWEKLLGLEHEIGECLPEVKEAWSHCHSNNLEASTCIECNPFGQNNTDSSVKIDYDMM